MRAGPARRQHSGMTSQTPLDAAVEVLRSPRLPAGDDERFVGFGVMGLPFAGGHYLALRHISATSYLARLPIGVAPRPGRPVDVLCDDAESAELCPILQLGDSQRRGPVRHRRRLGHPVVAIGRASPDLLEWHIDIRATASTRLMSTIGGRLPAGAWTNPLVLGALGRAAGPMLHAGQVRLSGTAPNGQRFMMAPEQVWSVAQSRAVLRDVDLGPVGPLHRQARLAGFRPPQRGLFVVGSGHFETFDPSRHRAPEGVGYAQ